MTITYLPYAPIQEGLAQIGKGLGTVLFPERQKIAALRQNPGQMIELAKLTRAARRNEGGVETLAETLGIPLDFLQQNEAAFPAGAQEQQEQRFLDIGGPEIVADSQVLQQLLQGEVSLEALKWGLPGLVTRQQATGAELGTAENLYNSRVISLRSRAGIPELSVNFEEAKLRADKAGVEFSDNMRAEFEKYFAGLDPVKDRHLIAMGAMAIANPEMLRHVQFHENLTFQQSVELARSRGSAADMLGVYLKLRDAKNEAIKMAVEGTGDPTEVVKDINALADMQLLLQNAGALPAFDLTTARDRGYFTALFSPGGQVALETPEVEELTRVDVALMRLQGGNGTWDDLVKSKFWTDLTPEEREQLTTRHLSRPDSTTGPQVPKAVQDAINAGKAPGFFDLDLQHKFSHDIYQILNTVGWHGMGT